MTSDLPGASQRHLLESRGWRGAVAAMGELLPVVLVLPIFWFPLTWPLLTLLALPVIPLAWLVRWQKYGRLTARTGAETPLLYVLIATCIATIPVFDVNLALPKILGMAVGAALFVIIGNLICSRARITVSITALTALTLGLAAVGLVGVEWTTGKVPFLDAVLERVPVVIRGVVPHSTHGGINPNELAGLMTLLLPVLAAQGLVNSGDRFAGLRSRLALLACAVGGVVLVATQSRTSIASTALVLVVLGAVVVGRIWRAGRLGLAGRVSIVVVYALLVGATAWIGWLVFRGGLVAQDGPVGVPALHGRLVLWSSGLSMLQDFALTGIGLGQFNPVFHILYAPPWYPPEAFVPAADNLVLEYALELGIPGAVAFALLVLVFFRRCRQATRCDDPLIRWTGVGLALGMIDFLLYGLTAAINPGARAGVVLWIVLGLGVAVGQLARTSPNQGYTAADKLNRRQPPASSIVVPAVSRVHSFAWVNGYDVRRNLGRLFDLRERPRIRR